MIRNELAAELISGYSHSAPVSDRDGNQDWRYRDLFENATDLIQCLNPDGTLAFVNRAWLRALNYGGDEVSTQPFLGFVHPEHVESTRSMLSRVLAGERLETVETILVSKDGRNLVVEGNCSCRFENGRPVSICGIFRDVTERKRREEELQRTQAFLNSVVENLPIGVFIKEARELRFVLWNKGNEDLLGYSSEEMLGKNDHDFFPREEADLFTAKDRETLSNPDRLNVSEETIHSRHRGKLILRTKKVPIPGADGEPAYLLGISEDITERVRVAAELELANQQLLEASRQTGRAEVVTGILHNVGNVLNSINVASTCLAAQIRRSKGANLGKVVDLLRVHQDNLGEFLTRDPKGKQVPIYLGHLAEHLASEQSEALKELKELQKNIEHIKDIVAMQQSYAKVSGVTEPMNVTELVEDAVRMNSSSLSRHDIEVVKEFSPVPQITVDKHKLLQILVNLVRNAKQACDESGRSDKRLTLRVNSGEGWVRLAVADNGIGITPENLSRIFAHGFTTKKDGHGFGLHSGALAAKEMGGSLRVQSAGVGQGATFIVELPLHASETTGF